MDFVDLVKEVCAEMGKNFVGDFEKMVPVLCLSGNIHCVGFVVDDEEDLAKVIAEFFALAVHKSLVKDLSDFVTRTKIALSHPHRAGNIVKFPRLYWEQNP